MFKTKTVFSGFSINDLAKTKEFYIKILGCNMEEETGMGLRLHLPGGGSVFMYPKDNHKAATFTILNFVVENIDETVDELTNNGVHFERYEGFNQDEKGIARGISHHKGPDIAWFKDPSGNILSVLQDAEKK